MSVIARYYGEKKDADGNVTDVLNGEVKLDVIFLQNKKRYILNWNISQGDIQQNKLEIVNITQEGEEEFIYKAEASNLLSYIEEKNYHNGICVVEDDSKLEIYTDCYFNGVEECYRATLQEIIIDRA